MNLDPVVTHVPKEMWPPSSPYLNLMYYWAWGYFEACTNRHAHTTKTSLVSIIKENFASLDRDMVIMDCGRFRGRVEAVIGADGNFIE